MTKRQMPPGRNSNAWVVVVKPFGPHHCAKCSGLENAENTSARGASKVRTKIIERASIASRLSLFAATPLLLALQFLQIRVEPVEALFPKPAIAPKPDVDVLERRAIDPARSSTFKCLDTAGRLMSNGSASAVTDASPSASRARIARRVGSASAANVVLRRSAAICVLNYFVN